MLPIRARNNPIRMQKVSFRSWLGQCGFGRLLRVLSLGTLLALPVLAEAPPKAYDPYAPLPQDTGATGLKQMLLRLQTTARLMQTVAHPDDEDGGMLTLESRGEGASVLLMTLTRGEGGQNKIGSNLFDVLGVLRTLELTAADRFYGVEQRFSRVADFGYSKNPEETFQKWQGHDIALADMVRVIRTFRPDVLIARFSGTDRDGHGHHQASAILTKEAFRAAADPNRFPEQIKEGLQPWQPKKLYIGNVCGFGALTCAPENYTVKLNTGVVNPGLGMSYIQFAMEGLRHQLSQGAGAWSVDPGDRFAFYKLVDSVLPPTTDKDEHEKDFWDGIDTSLPGLAARLGEEEKKVPWLRPGLAEMQEDVKQAQAADSSSAAQLLLSGLEVTQQLIQQSQDSTLSAPAKDSLLVELRTKQAQFEKAANFAAGVELQVSVDAPVGASADEAFEAVPGQSFELTARFSSHAQTVLNKIELDLPAGWTSKVVRPRSGSSPANSTETFQVTVAGDAKYTRPYWHRNNPEVDALNTIDDARDATLAFSPPPVQAHAVYVLAGKTGAARAVAMTKYKDSTAGVVERPLAVVPAFSVMLEPGSQTIRMAGDPGCDVKVGVSYNLSAAAKGDLRLQIPQGWRVEPGKLAAEFHQRREKRDFQFRVFPGSLKEGRAEIRAVLTSGGKNYSEGYSLVTREDLASAYYYQPAIQRVSVVDVNVPKDLKIGYIMGAGDDIPTVLEQIGMNVTLIPAEKLASEDLSRYGTMVLGIRAYDTQKDLIANNKKLLDYVSAGGTVLAQYDAGVGDFNGGHFTPYPAQLGRGRVSVEEAPIEILAPDDSVFHSPNQITQKDFDGWVQERGLYFMDQWDSHFKPLLASHDPGESPLKGGLLKAQYGKGIYIYTGYAFFRQLPAGVPGAIRLYVNLLSAGHEK